MKLFAISDIHLPGGQNKPMDRFGDNWGNHWANIRADWCERVGKEDIVLLPGDISWAMTLPEAAEDLAQIGELPGSKILLKGNHDYWWSSLSRVRALLKENCYALQNDALAVNGQVFCGSRGWVIPTAKSDEEEIKIFRREIMRLEMSLQAAAKKGGATVALLHYPPFLPDRKPTAVTRLLEDYGVKLAVYGHLHDVPEQPAEVCLNKVEYHLVSCDYLNFRLKELPLFE